MKKFGNYVIAVSLVFSAAVFGASLMTKNNLDKQTENTQTTKVDVMGNISGD